VHRFGRADPKSVQARLLREQELLRQLAEETGFIAAREKQFRD